QLALLRRPPSAALRCSTPPASSLLLLLFLLPVPPPPLPSLPHTPSAAPRSLPTQSEIPVSSPDRRSSPETRSPHRPAISLNPPSCTSALQLAEQTDRSRIALSSTPPDSDTHAPLPLLPRTTPLSLLSLPGAGFGPECKFACLLSVVRWESNRSHSQLR